MPLFELRATRRGRIRVFLRAQLPFAIGVAFIAVIALLVTPDSWRSAAMLAGFGLTVVATLAGLLVPWEKFSSSWLIVVAALDLLAVAFFRAELVTVVPAVTVLSLFPILWLAYGFPWYGIAVAVLGAGFITSFRSVYTGVWPSSAVEWANVVSFPTLIVGIAVIVFIAASHLRRNSQKLRDAYRVQSEALDEARNAETLAVGILNTVNAGVAFYDSEGRLAMANALARGMTEMVGFRLDEPPYAGDDVLAADRVSRVPYDEQIIPRALRGEVIENHMEWLGPPDAQVAIMASAQRLHRDDGKFLGTVIVASDVTELADAIEVREEFLRTVSHELRTPITSITGYLDLLDEALDPNDTVLRGYISVVTRRANDLLDRVRDLLQAEETGRLLDLARVDLGVLTRTLALGMEPTAQARGMSVRVTVPRDLIAVVDQKHMAIAVTELMNNAVKFGEEGTSIDVEVARTDDGVSISVRNVGPGITHAEQRRVFDRFYRAPYARIHAVQGFGLGLTNVRTVAHAHGGQVRVESVLGAHTTFTINLPTR